MCFSCQTASTRLAPVDAATGSQRPGRRPAAHDGAGGRTLRGSPRHTSTATA